MTGTGNQGTRAHLDLDAGIAGDMFLAACLDLGLDSGTLQQVWRGLGLDGWQLEVRRERRHGMAGVFCAIGAIGAVGAVGCEHGHLHDHGEHRHLAGILSHIDQAGFTPSVRERAIDIFRILAEAEAAVHGITPEDVHFHEVGALDAILDICGAAWAIEQLGLTRVTASSLQVGSGTVRCQHGLLPVPAPAVAFMLQRFAVPIVTGLTGEAATPTGVAILVHLVSHFGPSELTRIHRIGVGLGSREWPDRANALRILLQREEGIPCTVDSVPDPDLERDQVGLVVANMDDMNPQWYGPLWTQLLEAGALDVALVPLTMKKGRPGVRLEVMAPWEQTEALARMVLRQTSSLGVRIQQIDRLKWRRHRTTHVTPWGTTLRVTRTADGVPRLEFEDLAALAARRQWSLAEAQAQVLAWLSGPDS